MVKDMYKYFEDLALTMYRNSVWCGVVWFGVVWCGVVWLETLVRGKSCPHDFDLSTLS